MTEPTTEELEQVGEFIRVLKLRPNGLIRQEGRTIKVSALEYLLSCAQRLSDLEGKLQDEKAISFARLRSNERLVEKAADLEGKLEQTGLSLKDEVEARLAAEDRALGAEGKLGEARKDLTELAERLDRDATDRQAWADHPGIGGNKPRLYDHLRGKRYGYSHAAQLVRSLALKLTASGRQLMLIGHLSNFIAHLQRELPSSKRGNIRIVIETMDYETGMYVRRAFMDDLLRDSTLTKPDTPRELRVIGVPVRIVSDIT